MSKLSTRFFNDREVRAVYVKSPSSNALFALTEMHFSQPPVSQWPVLHWPLANGASKNSCRTW